MKKQFEIYKKTRLFLLDYIKDLSTDQLNQIPQGFNNNIIWNITHLIATHQGVCYVRSGHQLRVDEMIYNNYKNGTLPQPFVNSHQIENVKELLISSIDVLEKDYNEGLFEKYISWTTRTDVALKSIEESINFLLWHDGLHLGVIMAMKKLV
ncbi:DinB family protein [Pedobacter sp. SD-b]|uniref:DinB family protein n=1 Tax=Pedobacter segetis TaxID=2793069 RepID=A0ABS1BI81_9SPHI|nr:DinB family protein [Pedobacter segetis]MBK0382603.1 DinB family protein [Pedobacter segetis]